LNFSHLLQSYQWNPLAARENKGEAKTIKVEEHGGMPAQFDHPHEGHHEDRSQACHEKPRKNVA
jgi:hypothetical protein